MANFGKVVRVTALVGGREITFRSKLEYRWAVWCQLRKEQGLIKDWWYESDPILLERQYYKNKKVYIPDFTIQTLDDKYEFEETKGWFPPKDFTKIKLASEQYDNPITLIFAHLTHCKSQWRQYDRAKRLEKLIKCVIYRADRDIFKKISYLFDK